MKNLILIAAPGAGKGTLSKDLLEKYNYVHISTGDLLREQVAKGDELGKKINEMQTAGKLVTPEIVYSVLENKLNDPACDNGYILDGFPRNINQAYCYEEILKELNLNESIVIYLSLDKTIAEKRVLGRMVCPNCKSVYNKYFIENSIKL